MEINIIQLKIKNLPDYLFNDNSIVNVKDFDPSLLEINKLSFKGVFSFLMMSMDTLKKTMELNI